MTITTAPQPYRIPAADGLHDVWWKNGRVLVKAGADQTEGRLGQVEVIDPIGSATPLHLHHNEDETFYVLEGEVSVFVDGERIDLGPGDYACVPRGVPHAYVVRSAVARQLVTFSPSGFEEAFVALGVPAAESAQPDDSVFPAPEEMARVLGAYGCEILGPPPSID